MFYNIIFILFIDFANSIFTKFIENDNSKIIKKMKKLLYYYNRSIRIIKMKYFYSYYYKVLQLKRLEKKKKILEFKRIVKNKKDENDIFKNTFHPDSGKFFYKNKSYDYKSKHLDILNKTKKNKINNKGNAVQKREKHQNINKKNNYLLNNNFFNYYTLENEKFQNKFSAMLNDKNNNIIFNYINDMQNYNRLFTNKRRFLIKRKSDLTKGNKTLTNQIISKDMANKKKKWFDGDNNEIFNYKNKNKNIKKENEKNNEQKDIKTININNYYILNSSWIKENPNKNSFNELYEKEYNSSLLNNLLIKIKSPNKKLAKHLKQIKSTIMNINKNIKNDMFNGINTKTYKHCNTRNNFFYKSVQNKFPKSSKNNLKNWKLKKEKRNKIFPAVLKDRIDNKIQISKSPILNLTNKSNNNITFKPNYFMKSMNTRNIFDNYNNSLLTTYYKDKYNGKETDDSGFNTISKNTSNKKFLTNKFNVTNNKNKYEIPFPNDKQLDSIINNAFNINIKKNNTPNKKIPNAIEKKISYLENINNKKEKIYNHNLILQNLSFSNCSENKNLSENKAKNQIIKNKKMYDDINKIINQKLDYIFIKNDDEKEINNKNNENKRNKLIGKEKIIETSSETLNDSKIYELAKLYIQNDEEYFDKQIMEKILKIKELKNKSIK